MDTNDRRKNVFVRLHSTIAHPGQRAAQYDDEMSGTYIEKAGKSYLQFIDNETLTTVKLDKDDAFIMRKGAVQMRLPLGKSGRRIGSYSNGPIELELLVETLELVVEQTIDQTTFKTSYKLHAEDGLLGTYALTITFMEVAE